jgi:hypothetical protein
VSPGQACSYKIGHNAILLQRERARKALDDRFDLAAFIDALIVSCGMPLRTMFDHGAAPWPLPRAAASLLPICHLLPVSPERRF